MPDEQDLYKAIWSRSIAAVALGFKYRPVRAMKSRRFKTFD
jgi:hypothetical protein